MDTSKGLFALSPAIMKRLRLLGCLLLLVASSSRSSEAVEDTPTTTMTTSDRPTTRKPLVHEEAKELPVDLLSPGDKVLLDPNVVLARVVRDAYNYGGGWGDKRQSFGRPYERRPFGIDGYYERLKGYNGRNELAVRRRNEQVRRRYQVTLKPFRVYPVFPG